MAELYSQPNDRWWSAESRCVGQDERDVAWGTTDAIHYDTLASSGTAAKLQQRPDDAVACS